MLAAQGAGSPRRNIAPGDRGGKSSSVSGRGTAGLGCRDGWPGVPRGELDTGEPSRVSYAPDHTLNLPRDSAATSPVSAGRVRPLSSGIVPFSSPESLVEGHRFGVAHDELASFYNEVTRTLAAMYDQNVARGVVVEDIARRAERAELWMQHHDLAAYVLLGDPAARLPIAQLPIGVQRSQRKPAVVPSAGARDVRDMEAAVMEYFQRREEAEAIAHRYGVTQKELGRWVDSFREGGRKELAKLSETAGREGDSG